MLGISVAEVHIEHTRNIRSKFIRPVAGHNRQKQCKDAEKVKSLHKFEIKLAKIIILLRHCVIIDAQQTESLQSVSDACG